MSFTEDQLDITNELCEVIRLHNQMIQRLQKYRKDYPWLMPPNVCAFVEDNLKENAQMLLKEMNNLHKPKGEQKRYVCPQCNHVFAAPLKGGICDACRGRATPHRPDYNAGVGRVTETPTAVFRSDDLIPATTQSPESPGEDREGSKIHNDLLAALAEMESHDPGEYPDTDEVTASESPVAAPAVPEETPGT